MRPFPWKCRECGQASVSPVTVDYSTDREHDGRSYSLTVPGLEVLECASCGSRVLPDRSREKVTEALRTAAGLLTPDEIREQRKYLGLTQEQLANSLRIAKETVSRWETGGQIQQRAMDLLLRVFFDLPEGRDFLASRTSATSTMTFHSSVSLDPSRPKLAIYHPHEGEQVIDDGPYRPAKSL